MNGCHATQTESQPFVRAAKALIGIRHEKTQQSGTARNGPRHTTPAANTKRITKHEVSNPSEKARSQISSSKKARNSKNCVHWAGVEQLPVHRWFRYREGYSPLLFSHFTDSQSRFDPFCGCGTTLLSSSSEGVNSFGLDLNPLATFVATVKTRRYTVGDLKSI